MFRFIRFEIIKLLYFLLFIIFIFLLNFVFVNEEFYVSIGLFFFILFIYNLISSLLMNNNFIQLNEDFLFIQSFLFKYNNFLKTNLNFFSLDIIVWFFLYKIHNLIFNYKFNFLNNKISQLYSMDLYLKLFFKFIYNKIIYLFIFNLLLNLFNFLKIYYLDNLLTDIELEKKFDEEILNLFKFVNKL